MQMQDTEILEKIHKEPESGMKLLMEQYAGLIYAVVKGKLQSSVFCITDIENCVADTFSEFYCSIDKYNSDLGSVKAWLCVIAKNIAIDYIRKYYKEKDNVSLNEEQSEQFEDEISIEGDFEDKALRLELMKEIKNLGEPDHEIIIRKFYLSQSSKEIADKLNMTVANVDTRTHRAIKRLRERLGGVCS